jgi:hypothetical protein
MPRGTTPVLGDDLLDAYRTFVAEVYDRLSADGFPDVPQAATTLFRDIDGRGSRIPDLAVQAGFSVPMMQTVVAELEARGYIVVDGEVVRPAARGHEAFAAGRRALAATEEHWEQQLGTERFATFREVLRDIVRRG